MQRSQTGIGLFLLIMLGIIWGTGYSIARFAMTNGVPPLGYSFWQSLGPAIIITLCLIIQKKFPPLSTTNMRFYLISGLTGIAIPNTAMYFAASHLPAGILAMVVNVVPIIAYPMALFAGLEKFDRIRMLGIVIACCGIMFIIIPRTSLPSADMVPWVLSTLITPLSFAFCSIYVARYRPPHTNSLTLSAGMLIASSLLLLPLVIFSQQFYFFHFPFTLPDYVVVLEIILSSIGYILFFQLIKVAGPVYYSLVDTVVVMTGLIWGFIIFGEHLNSWTATAVCLIIVSLLLVTQRQRFVTKGTLKSK